MGTTRTSRRGKIEGHVLVDALMATLLAALVAGAIAPGIGIAARVSESFLERAIAGIEERSALAAQGANVREP